MPCRRVAAMVATGCLHSPASPVISWMAPELVRLRPRTGLRQHLDWNGMRRPSGMGADRAARSMHGSAGAGASQGADAPPKDREAQNARQAATFDDSVTYFASDKAVPKEVVPRLAAIARAVAIPQGGRIVDVGAGVECLLPHYQREAGADPSRVMAVDLSPKMIAELQSRFPTAHTFVGDFVDFKPPQDPNVQGSAAALVDAVVFNAMFGNMWDQEAALAHAAGILKVGGRIVISHPLGRKCPASLKARDPVMVPHELPTADELRRMTEFLPLSLESMEDDGDLYLAVLKRATHRTLQEVFYARGVVSTGYGRGSKQIGVATANLPESLLSEDLKNVPAGVYCGWAVVEDATGAPASGPRKMVANVGYSPTFEGKENREKIIEAHLIGYTGPDFYGKTMRLVLVAHQRAETKFASFPELVATIKQDVQNAEAALDTEPLADFAEDRWLLEAQDAASLASWKVVAFRDARPSEPRS